MTAMPAEQPDGVWASYYSDSSGSTVVFRTEVEAYRDALPSMKSVVFLPFGVEVNDAAAQDRARKASE